MRRHTIRGHQIEVGPRRVAVTACGLEIIEGGTFPVTTARRPRRAALEPEVRRRRHPTRCRIGREQLDDVRSILEEGTEAIRILDVGPGTNVQDPNRFGPLFEDRPHVVKLFTTYAATSRVTTSAYFRF